MSDRLPCSEAEDSLYLSAKANITGDYWLDIATFIRQNGRGFIPEDLRIKLVKSSVLFIRQV